MFQNLCGPVPRCFPGARMVIAVRFIRGIILVLWVRGHGEDRQARNRGHMKGVVLAGGTGSRLNPLTRVTNKHLLPIYDKPMVYYPIQTLVNAGIEDILLVTGGQNAGDFLRLIGNGRDFGLRHVNYTHQEGEGGIAEALGLAEFFAAGGPICVVLGDNIIENNICAAVENFKKQESGARILLQEVRDAQRFGAAEIRGDRVVGIEEKPKAPERG